MMPIESPVAGELWRHRRSKRICKVTGVRYVGDLVFVLFKYRRDAALAAPGLGWKNKTPEQEMPLEQWRSFFTVRTAEASRG